IAGVIAPAPSSSNRAPAPHVRPLCVSAQTLVQEGARRSPTVSGFLQRVEDSSVVLYIDVDPFLRARAGLKFVSSASGVTYLLALINPSAAIADEIVVLAHELQHVAEVIASPWPIKSTADLERLYARIGFRAPEAGFETDAALATERVARKELQRAGII